MSGQSLTGVETTWRQDRYDLLLGVSHTGPTNLPPSGEDGVITVPGLHETWASCFVFSRPGYATAYGAYCRGALSLAGRINSLHTDTGFILEGPLAVSRATDGLVPVPMKRQ